MQHHGLLLHDRLPVRHHQDVLVVVLRVEGVLLLQLHRQLWVLLHLLQLQVVLQLRLVVVLLRLHLQLPLDLHMLQLQLLLHLLLASVSAVLDAPRSGRLLAYAHRHLLRRPAADAVAAARALERRAAHAQLLSSFRQPVAKVRNQLVVAAHRRKQQTGAMAGGARLELVVAGNLWHCSMRLRDTRQPPHAADGRSITDTGLSSQYGCW
eukprot:362321-Chlamydomonas_euryale.AAC.2